MEYKQYTVDLYVKIKDRSFLFTSKDSKISLIRVDNLIGKVKKITTMPNVRNLGKVMGYNNHECLYRGDTGNICKFKGYYITYIFDYVYNIYKVIDDDNYWFWQNIPIYTCKYMSPIKKHGPILFNDDGCIFKNTSMLHLRLEEFKIYETEEQYPCIKIGDKYMYLFINRGLEVTKPIVASYDLIKINNNIHNLEYYYNAYNKVMTFLLCINRIKLPKYIVYKCCY